VNEIMIRPTMIGTWTNVRAYPTGSSRVSPSLFEPELAAKEIRRLAAKGCHAVTFSENPEASACQAFIPGLGSTLRRRV